MCWHPAKHTANAFNSSGFALSFASKSWSRSSNSSVICEIERLMHATSVLSAVMESEAVL